MSTYSGFPGFSLKAELRIFFFSSAKLTSPSAKLAAREEEEEVLPLDAQYHDVFDTPIQLLKRLGTPERSSMTPVCVMLRIFWGLRT